MMAARAGRFMAEIRSEKAIGWVCEQMNDGHWITVGMIQQLTGGGDEHRLMGGELGTVAGSGFPTPLMCNGGKHIGRVRYESGSAACLI